MKVKIIFTSWFKRYTGGLSSLEQEFCPGETAWDIVCKSGIPEDEIGFITVCNQEQPGFEKKVDEATIAADGDELKVYPIIIGG